MREELSSTPLVASLGKEFFAVVPRVPGVYLMLDERGELLYVGKAKDLRARLRTYARVTADDRNRRLVRLVSTVRAIRWEERKSEGDALARETELLRAVRPAFNKSQTDRTEYFFVALLDRPDGRVRMRLTQHPSPDETAFGCYQFAARAWDHFTVLARVVATVAEGRPPSQPQKATGCLLRVGADLRASLEAYLEGRNDALVKAIGDGDGFGAWSLRRDAESLAPFYELGPRATRQLRRKHGLTGRGPVTAEQMDEILATRARDTIDVEVRERTERTRTPRGAREALATRAAAWRAEGVDDAEIARRFNVERTPRVRGTGPWRPADVEVLLNPRGRSARARRSR